MKINKIKKIVIKIGSSSISSIKNGLNQSNINILVNEIDWLKKHGFKVVLVSSGAISLGLHVSGKQNRPTKLAQLQSLAAIGQIELMQAYKKFFHKNNKDIQIGQVLLTNDDLVSRERYLNAKNALDELLKSGVVPIVNENDTVAYDEIQFGDNDMLASRVANLIQADLLTIFTDQDGLFDKDPSKHLDAKLIEKIQSDDPLLTDISQNTSSSSGIGSGGIRSKIYAAKTAARGGASTIIGKGMIKNFFKDFFDNNLKVTIISPIQKKNNAKQTWMIDNSKPIGQLFLDDGAIKALIENKKSLLPIGVKSFSGNFQRGDLLSCMNKDGVEVARGLSNFSSIDVEKIIGQQTDRKNQSLENMIEENLIHRNNLVII